MIKFTFLLLVCFCSCGRTHDVAVLNGGSLSLDYGGSFYRMTEQDFEKYSIKRMTVSLISKPVGLAIRHNFIAIQLNDEKIYTLGLIATDDLAFYKKNIGKKEMVLKQFEIDDTNEVVSSYQTAKRYLDHHPYRNRLVYGSALIATPIGGRPCSNVAFRLFEIMSHFQR